MDPLLLPEGLEFVRSTDEFDNESAPAGLFRSHRVASGVWGRLVIHSGTVGFVFEDDSDDQITLSAGASTAIPPQRPHRVVLDGHATFCVEFYREPLEQAPVVGAESTGLLPVPD